MTAVVFVVVMDDENAILSAAMDADPTCPDDDNDIMLYWCCICCEVVAVTINPEEGIADSGMTETGAANTFDNDES